MLVTVEHHAGAYLISAVNRRIKDDWNNPWSRLVQTDWDYPSTADSLGVPSQARPDGRRQPVSSPGHRRNGGLPGLRAECEDLYQRRRGVSGRALQLRRVQASAGRINPVRRVRRRMTKTL